MLPRIVAAIALAACSGTAPRATPPETPPPPASTLCYAGMSVGMGQTARTLVRRNFDPVAHQILEDVRHDDGGAHGAKSFHVVIAVDGDHFTMTEAGNAFRGSGTLVGEPWRWTAWSSTSEIPNTGITVSSDDELTDTGMVARKEIKREGKVLGTTKDDLKAFDCATWDAAVAELAAPAINHATCERACRNFATLRFWSRADADIAARPAADQPAAREKKTAEFAPQLEAGLPTCIAACVTAKNGSQTACMGTARSVAELTACE